MACLGCASGLVVVLSLRLISWDDEKHGDRTIQAREMANERYVTYELFPKSTRETSRPEPKSPDNWCCFQKGRRGGDRYTLPYFFKSASHITASAEFFRLGMESA